MGFVSKNLYVTKHFISPK